VRRSCGVLLKSSSRGPCIKILQILRIACMKVLLECYKKFVHEDLVGCALQIDIEGPAVAADHV